MPSARIADQPTVCPPALENHRPRGLIAAFADHLGALSSVLPKRFKSQMGMLFKEIPALFKTHADENIQS